MPSLVDGWPHYVVILAVASANYWVVSPVIGMAAPLWRTRSGRLLLLVSGAWFLGSLASPGVSLRLQMGGQPFAAALLAVLQLGLAWRAGLVVRRWLAWSLWEGTLDRLRPAHIADVGLRSWALAPGTRVWIRHLLTQAGDRWSTGRWDDMIPRPPFASVARLDVPPPWTTRESALLDQEILASVLRQVQALMAQVESPVPPDAGALLRTQAARRFRATRAREQALRGFLGPLWWVALKKPLPRHLEAELESLAALARQIEREDPRDSAEVEGIREALRIADEVLGWKPGAV